jgi:hypothetical protein
MPPAIARIIALLKPEERMEWVTLPTDLMSLHSMLPVYEQFRAHLNSIPLLLCEDDWMAYWNWLAQQCVCQQ